MMRPIRTIMFDLDQFITDCRTTLAAYKSHKLVREIPGIVTRPVEQEMFGALTDDREDRRRPLPIIAGFFAGLGRYRSALEAH